MVGGSSVRGVPFRIDESRTLQKAQDVIVHLVQRIVVFYLCSLSGAVFDSSCKPLSSSFLIVLLSTSLPRLISFVHLDNAVHNASLISFVIVIIWAPIIIIIFMLNLCRETYRVQYWWGFLEYKKAHISVGFS